LVPCTAGPLARDDAAPPGAHSYEPLRSITEFSYPRPGTGTIITGAAANEAKTAAVAKYPGGTVNRVLKLSDDSYAVHQIKISWPHHVFVTKNFKVTGAIG
jgi:hypothetical protein